MPRKRKLVALAAHVELEDESDEELKDIGIGPPKRDFDAVQPFWIP